MKFGTEVEHNITTRRKGKFYYCLGKTYLIVKDAPDKERIENFREEIYEKQVIHNGEACWIKGQDQPHPNMEWKQVSEQDVADALRTTLNWKAL